MGSPSNPITLSVEQIEDLKKQLATCRHNINNQLSLIVAAAELIKIKPDMLPRLIQTLSEQPPKITEELKKFSAVFEHSLDPTSS